MVRGESVMFYIHYNEDGDIISVANHNNATLSIPTTKEMYDDFSFGKNISMNTKLLKMYTLKEKCMLFL